MKSKAVLPNFITTLIFFLMVVSCASEQSKVENNRVAQNVANQNENVEDLKEVIETEKTNDQTIQDPLDKSKVYFTESILPAFKEKCSSCHVKDNIGPLSIYEFTKMHALLLIGDTQDSNKLFQKIRNAEGASHVGGDQCSTPINEAEICQKIIDWWYLTQNKQAEDPPLDPVPPDISIIGSLVEITETGAIRGWAAIANDETKILEVKLYVEGGDLPQAVLMTSVLANQDAFDNETPGSHAFTAEIADLYKDGKSYKLTAKAVFENSEHVLFGSAMNFSIGGAVSLGRQYFENTLKSKLIASCSGCHSIDYETQKQELALPAVGGSSTNNRLIRMAADIINHPGGNRCPGGINTSPCSEIQVWWTQEFGD